MRVASPPFLVAHWDAEGRVLDLHYPSESALSDDMVDETIRFLDAFTEEHGTRFGILVDAAHIRDASSGYRRALATWFKAHARESRMAIYNLSPFVRVMTLLFATATRFPVKIATDREEALQWLRPVLTR